MSMERSPSPPIQPPVASTPGPRATALQRLYADATAHVIKTCSYKVFANCFPTPAQVRPDSLRDLHEQFTTSLGKSMRAHFEDILLDRNVVPSLNELDQLIDDAKRRRARAKEDGTAGSANEYPTPPHALPAKELYNAYFASSLQASSDDLNQRQEQLSQENTEMLERVMQQRRQIKELLSTLEGSVAELEQSASMLSPEDVDELKKESRDAYEATMNNV